MRHTYTSAEKEFIRNNYPTKGSEFCAKELNLPARKIQKQADYLGVKITNGLRSQLVKDNYHKNFPNVDENLSERLFEDWPNFWVYFLGYLWADGTLEKGTFRTSLKINEEDGRHIISLIEKNKEFSFIKIKWLKKRQETWKDSYQFRFSNKNIYLKLLEMGYGNKSKGKHLVLDFIPENKKHLWLLGFFDGDGCLTKTNREKSSFFEVCPHKIFFCSDYETDWSMFISFLKEIGILDMREHKRTNNKNQRSSEVSIGKINEVIKVLNYMYSNPSFGLPRKYEKATKTSSVFKSHEYNRNLILSEQDLENLRSSFDHLQRNNKNSKKNLTK